MNTWIARSRNGAFVAGHEPRSGRIRSATSLAVVWLGMASCAVAADPGPAKDVAPFAIRVVDEETNRGVPLVQLKTTSNQTYLTDSNGYVAIDDPTLMGRKVFFHVSSHGHEYPKDGFGNRGSALHVQSNGEATLKIKRTNIAERLYRITGAGIYRDSVKLGRKVPIEKPLLNASVTGQDTVQTVVKGNRIYWFWGDTGRLEYPLGQFNTSGAISILPRAGGLNPARGINLDYFVDASGFSRPMFKRENGVLIWVHGVFSVNGEDGEPRILTHYSRRKSLQHQLSHGLAVLNEDKGLFEPIVRYDEDEKLYPRGQSFRMREKGTDYICFADPYARVRVRATWAAALDPNQYEAFTPLKVGSADVNQDNLDRTDSGTLRYAWKQNTAPVDVGQLQQWVRREVIQESDNWFRTVDAVTKRPIWLHRGSIHWNQFRRRWIMIAHEMGGKPSHLGEVWYSEALEPAGPFPLAVKIVTHDEYTFYNVAHHAFFDQEQGRIIYFEGTYSNMFAKSPVRTPWYDYNQIMYRLDLGDPRLLPAVGPPLMDADLE
jgi:hypothetical protein